MSDLPDQPETETTTTDEDEGDSALDRAAESIREARDAEGSVAASEDITALDEQRAGESTTDPQGEGGAV